MSSCHVHNFICIYELFDFTPIHDRTGREGFCNVPTYIGGDILPTTPLYPYTPLPPTYPPSPSYHFGGQKGGIMLLRKRATKKPKKNFWKNFWEKRELLFITVGYIYL
jgi:hypothetical protein